MSANAAISTQPQPEIGAQGPSQPGSAQTGHVVSIVSPAVARAIVAELMMSPERLSDAMRTALSSAEGGDKAMAAALERMTVWADLSSLVLQGLHAQEKERRKVSLTYFVLRQAHFGLLYQLFKVSRYEVRQIRQELGVSVETRPKLIPESDLADIHAVWASLCKEYRNYEADRWISLAERFPQYGLNSLYQVIVGESRDAQG